MQALFENMHQENPVSFLFIDGSYFCFYRYHSIMRWWKNIWRNDFYDNYKGTRVNDPGFMGGKLFKMAYDENLFQQGGARAILSHPKLEADDCVAISVKHVLKTYPNATINIITSDKDYLQLAGPNVKIFNLVFKNISELTLGGSAEADLFCKIVMGDTSDNITSVLRKCGPKTALKCYNDKTYFNERMQSENAHDKFALNQKIIDFNYIPQNLVDEFMQSKNCVYI